MLDNIDYITHVMILAFAPTSAALGERLSLLSAAIIVISSAIYYATPA